MRKARYPLAEITWVDSSQLEGGSWMNLSEVKPMLNPDDVTCRTVGWLVAESETVLALARSISEWESAEADEKAEGVLLIPQVAVLERRDR